MAKEDYKTVIKIEGDEKGALAAVKRAEAALGSLANTIKTKFSAAAIVLRGIRTAISGVMRALGVFYLAAEGIKLVVTTLQKLYEWAHRAEKAARELADSLSRDSIATAAANATAAYEKLNKQIAESNRLERERSAILDKRLATSRALEDATLEREKQADIAKLDPASATYAENRAAIERSYARRASTLAVARADENSRAGAQQLYAEANRKDLDANKLQAEYERQMRIADRARDRVFALGMRARRGEEGAQEKHDEAEQQYWQTYDGAMKVKEAMEAMRKEADSIRARAAEMAGGSREARIRDEATQAKITNDEKAAAAKKAAAEEEKRKADERRAAAAQLEIDKQAAIARLDPSAVGFGDARAAIERTYRKRGLEARLAATGEGTPERLETEAELAQLANEERIAAAKTDAGISREAITLGAGSRLNAMGLGAGSGVQRVQQEMVNSLKDLVRLGRDQLAALKDIQNEDAGATFQ